ncbi:helix-turn-helix domain-containing protein [Sphingomonas sp. TX0543]|uniref:helix-turn-helix domain-containing protein n=1 Tax=unclassified Sphingomonas TaxID=196159 RepID=UPI0010F4A51B|nr:helix-turn-helix transcriptional regulator [Sphingomonas sp. 3P27F8]
MPNVEFNARAFYLALDGARAAKDLNWKQVAEKSGVSASTLTRLSQGKRPDVDSMAALVSWSGLSADEFVTGGRGQRPEALSQITSLLSADARLTTESRDAMIGMVTAAYQRMAKVDIKK